MLTENRPASVAESRPSRKREALQPKIFGFSSALVNKSPPLPDSSPGEIKERVASSELESAKLKALSEGLHDRKPAVKSVKKRPLSAPVIPNVFDSELPLPQEQVSIEPVVVSCKTGEKICGHDMPLMVESIQPSCKGPLKWKDLDGMTIEDLIDYDDDYNEESFKR